MAITVTSLLARALKRYPDMNDGGSHALELAQEAHDEILREVPLVTDSETISLTDADPTYDLDEDILTVWSATWIRSATAGDVKPLPVVSQTWLDINRPGWRHRPAQAEPEFVIFEGTNDTLAKGQVRTVPDLDITVAGGYPNIELIVTRKQTLGTASNTTSLPQQVKDPTAWLRSMYKRFAEEYAPEDYDRHDLACERAKTKLKADTQSVAVEVQPEIIPYWVQQGRAR